MKLFLRYAFAAIVIISLWKLGSVTLGEHLLPPPLNVLIYFYHSIQTKIFLEHALISSLRISIAMTLAWSIAFPFGIFLGNVKLADTFITPLFFLTYPIPKIVLLPIFLTIFGLDELPKILLITLTTGYQILIVTRASTVMLDKKYRDSFQSIGGTALQELYHVIIPAALPNALTALKIASGTATAVLFMVESFATQKGLGFLIIDGWGRGDMLEMYNAILAMSLLGMSLHEFFNCLERYFCRWNHLQAGKL